MDRITKVSAICSFLVSIFLFFLPLSANAAAGCCSSHGGVAGCNKSTNHLSCKDGTTSPTCTCEGTTTKKPAKASTATAAPAAAPAAAATTAGTTSQPATETKAEKKAKAKAKEEKATKTGCCSGHGGVDKCNKSAGYQVCKDGTQSTTCTCGKKK